MEGKRDGMYNPRAVVSSWHPLIRYWCRWLDSGVPTSNFVDRPLLGPSPLTVPQVLVIRWLCLLWITYAAFKQLLICLADVLQHFLGCAFCDLFAEGAFQGDSATLQHLRFSTRLRDILAVQYCWLRQW